MTHHADAERAELLHALEESQSLFAAMLHEPRPTSEIQKQMEQNRAAIDAARRDTAAPVTRGWKLVPEWPTVEMSVAGDDVYREDGPDVFSSNTIYTRMLAAAPAHPAEGVPAQAEPFMWGIQEPGGSAYMDKNCVSTSRGIVEAEVDGLNLGLDADDEPYKVVPVYLAATQPPEAAPVQLPDPGINTANHAGIRVIGYTEQQVRELLAAHGIGEA